MNNENFVNLPINLPIFLDDGSYPNYLVSYSDIDNLKEDLIPAKLI